MALSRRGIQALACAVLLTPVAIAAPPAAAPARMSAAQVVARCVAARGGTQGWHAVQAMSLSGKLEGGNRDAVARSERVAQPGAGGSAHRARVAAAEAATTVAHEQVLLPFELRLQRPGKSRLEIGFAGKTAVQVFDGAQGWKKRPYLNRDVVEPFTPDEIKGASAGTALDFALLDYEARGTRIELAANEPVDGKDAYKLKLTLRDGSVRNIWVDAQSFLDVKVEGPPREMDGRLHAVWTYQRDFRSVQGIKLPYVLETAVDGYPDRHKVMIESVVLNPKLDSALFGKPVG